MRFARLLPSFACAALAVSLPVGGAYAQPGEPLQDIEVGSSRIGGPGLTPNERARNAPSAGDESDTALTEETLPKKGDKRRLPGLHKIAGRYARAQMWKDACDRYDQILDENGPEGMDADPAARGYAGLSYLKCGEIDSHAANGADKAEALLKKSERYIKGDYRHAAIRRTMKREAYRTEFAKGNTEKALTIFRAYQAEKADEDERIWMGEELSKIAVAAYNNKDKVALERAMKDCEAVAPLNTEYRRLKEKIDDESQVWTRVITLSVLGLVGVVVLQQLFAWRERARVGEAGRVSGKKNKFLDD